jgi:MFS transporter, putative metabolite:H+ symporter
MADTAVPVGASPTVTPSSSTTADLLIARLERLPFTRRHWLVAAVLCTATFFDGYDNLMITATLPLIIAGLGLSLGQAGVLITATFWGQAIGAPLSGILAERWGRRAVLLISCGVMGVTAIGAALAQNLDQLIWARAIQGLGVGAEVPIAGAMFNEFVKSRNRGAVVMAYETMFSWGGFVAPWLALGMIALIGQNEAWRGMFLFASLPLVMVFIRNRFLPESPRWLLNRGRFGQAEQVVADLEASATRAHQPLPEPVVVAQPLVKPTNFLELFQSEYRGRTAMMLVWIGMTYAYTYGYAPFVAALYTSVGGLPVANALLLAAAAQLVSTPYLYVVGYFLDRLGRRFFFGWGLVYAAVVLFIGAIVVGPLGMRSWPVLFALTVLLNFGISPSNAGFYVYGPELFPTRMRAWATAVGSTAIRAISSFMAIVVGTVAGSTLGLGGVYLLMGVLILIGGVTVLRWGPETRRRVLEEIAA